MDDNFGMDVGRRIRALREARRISINDFADAVGIGRGTIWTLEAGKVSNPAAYTVMRCAEFFGVRIDQLLYDHVDEASFVFGRSFPTLDVGDRSAVVSLCERLSHREADMPSHA